MQVQRTIKAKRDRLIDKSIRSRLSARSSYSSCIMIGLSVSSCMLACVVWERQSAASGNTVM